MNKLLVTQRFLKKLKLDGDFYDLPYDLKIATITLTCKLDTLMNIKTIGYYLDLNINDVVYVKYGPDLIVRSLIKLKKNYKIKTPVEKKKNFQNQVSVKIMIRNKRCITVKLFSNGAMQITGCKTIYNFVEVMTILCSKLLDVKFVYDTATKKIIKKTFVTNPNGVKIINITCLTIRMINSSFHVGFLIDRIILYKLLLEKGHECTYDQCSHAGINLKYKIGDDTISLLIFESGSIIITGAKTKNHIWEAYDFIVKILYENFNVIVKLDMGQLLNRPDIKKMIKDECELIKK